MKIYLVGGAVRDKLLGKKPKERDFVVVGSTPAEMLALGFRKVGKNFPVFLHPKTHEEYALARTERKTGKGYFGFKCYTSKNVTLEEDLKRRDLTINAMAEDEKGRLFDPYGGQKDLKKRVLRHVSEAFAEDPLRVLRVARFTAKFADFKIHPKTLKLMQDLVKANEIEALVTERVWQEIENSLQEKNPERFWQTLEECGALKIILPEILKNVPDALKRLKKATKLSKNSAVRLAAFLSILDPTAVNKISSRLRLPKVYSDIAILTARNLEHFHNATKLSAEEIITFLEKTDAFRRQERWECFLLASESSSPKTPSANFQHLKKAHKVASSISGAALAKKNLSGLELKEALRKKRVLALKKKR